MKRCIGYKRTDLPLKEAQDDENGFHSDSNFCNPYGKITCLILSLMSMELGSPPLYATFNKASRAMDVKMLNNLGPLARALGKILINAEIYRKEKDKLESGWKINEEVDQNLAGAFIAFKGGLLENSWLRGWEAKNKDQIKVPNNWSFFENVGTALEHSFEGSEGTEENMTPVLFVLSCLNYRGFNGVRLNSECYSLYPQEMEVMIADGSDVEVLDIQKDVKIKNGDETFKKFNNKPLTIVYLFHQG